MTFDPLEHYEEQQRKQRRYDSNLPVFIVAVVLLVAFYAFFCAYQRSHAKPKPAGKPSDVVLHDAYGRHIEPDGTVWLRCNDGYSVYDLKDCPEYDDAWYNPATGRHLVIEPRKPSKHKRKAFDPPGHVTAYEPSAHDDFILFTQEVSPSPANVHEYAMQQIKEWFDYRSHEHRAGEYTLKPIDDWARFHVSIFTFANDTKQSFSIDKDGKIILENMTVEDALLSMAAMESRKTLDEMKRWDMDERNREEERESNPPSTLKAGKLSYKVTPVNQLGEGILETTNCGTHKIDVLMSDGAKRVGVLHEMMHVATGCDPSPGLHKAIYQMQGPLLKLFQDNPKMMDYLLKRSPSDVTNLMEKIAPTKTQSDITIIRIPDGTCETEEEWLDAESGGHRSQRSAVLCPAPYKYGDPEHIDWTLPCNHGDASGEGGLVVDNKGCVHPEGWRAPVEDCKMPADIDVCPVQTPDSKVKP